MENERVALVSELLALKRQIVGVRFLVYKKDFDECTAEAFQGKLRLCGFVNKANYGARIKACLENFACPGGANQMGMSPTLACDLTGQGQWHCGLYSDLSNGRAGAANFSQIPQHIYGVEVAPLDQMEDADVVVIVGMAEQIMKVIQGYTWHYGIPKPFLTMGNVAVCSDLVAKPFLKNDINLSVMCYGARNSMLSDVGELGVGMPSHMFRHVADGTINITKLEKGGALE